MVGHRDRRGGDRQGQRRGRCGDHLQGVMGTHSSGPLHNRRRRAVQQLQWVFHCREMVVRGEALPGLPLPCTHNFPARSQRVQGFLCSRQTGESPWSPWPSPQVEKQSGGHEENSGLSPHPLAQPQLIFLLPDWHALWGSGMCETRCGCCDWQGFGLSSVDCAEESGLQQKPQSSPNLQTHGVSLKFTAGRP